MRVQYDRGEMCCRSHDSFKGEMGLHQVWALHPFLLAIMDRLTDEVRRESPWTMMTL